MSRFYGFIQGQARNPVTRCGSTNSGMIAHICGWDVGVKIICEADGDRDLIHIFRTGGSNNSDEMELVETLSYFPSRDYSDLEIFVKPHSDWEL